MENITQLHKEVVKYLNKHNNSWLPLGIKLLELTEAIGDMKKAKYWEKHFKVPSFQHYCSEILNENADTMSKYRMNAKCIRDYRNDLYEKWEEDNSTQIPGYTIFYELLAKKNALSDDKFKEILDFIIDDSYSLSKVREEVYDSIAKKSKVKKEPDDDDETQLISFDKLEGREVLYVLRIPEIKDEIKTYYDGVVDDELKTVELLIDELLKHLRSLSLRLERAENAE